jgi:hypothetical protein
MISKVSRQLFFKCLRVGSWVRCIPYVWVWKNCEENCLNVLKKDLEQKWSHRLWLFIAAFNLLFKLGTLGSKLRTFFFGKDVEAVEVILALCTSSVLVMLIPISLLSLFWSSDHQFLFIQPSS